MTGPASFFLEPCDDGRGYQFRSVEALQILLDLDPPYRTCLAHAPYARNAPHCSRVVNKKRAASVPGLLRRLARTRVPSIAAGSLFKDLSTCAVCGIVGWHQYKAAEVQSQWLSNLWGEYLRVHGLKPRLWRLKIPSMTVYGWETGLRRARLQQGYDSEDDSNDDGGYHSDSDGSVESDVDEDDEDDENEDDDEDDDESEDDYSDSEDDYSGSEDDYPDSEDDYPDSEDSYSDSEDDTSQVILNTAVQSPDDTTSNSGEWQDGLALDDTESWSSEGIATPDTSISDSDESFTEEADLAPDTTVDFDQISTNDDQLGPGEQNEGDTDEDSVTDNILSLGNDIFTDSGETSASSSTDGQPARLGFRLYPQAPSPASQLMQLLNMMTQTVSHRRRYAGYIYGFARPSLPGFLKIGVVKDTVIPRRLHPDPVDHRLATWQAQCGHPIVEVFRKRIICNAAERIESLVHLALREYRRVEDPPCRRCERRKRAARARHRGQRGGGKHDEWFEVDTETAMRVVALLAAFSDRQPYDRFGKLIDFWSNKAEQKKRGVGPGDTTYGWLQTIPRLAEEQTRVELDDIIGRFWSIG